MHLIKWLKSLYVRGVRREVIDSYRQAYCDYVEMNKDLDVIFDPQRSGKIDTGTAFFSLRYCHEYFNNYLCYAFGFNRVVDDDWLNFFWITANYRIAKDKTNCSNEPMYCVPTKNIINYVNVYIHSSYPPEKAKKLAYTFVKEKIAFAHVLYEEEKRHKKMMEERHRQVRNLK